VPVGVRVYQWQSGALGNDGERVELSMPGDQKWQWDRYYVRVDRIDYDDAHP